MKNITIHSLPHTKSDKQAEDAQNPLYTEEWLTKEIAYLEAEVEYLAQEMNGTEDKDKLEILEDKIQCRTLIMDDYKRILKQITAYKEALKEQPDMIPGCEYECYYCKKDRDVCKTKNQCTGYKDKGGSLVSKKEALFFGIVLWATLLLMWFAFD